MRNKLGLFGVNEKDKFLILDLLTWMHQKKINYLMIMILWIGKKDGKKDYQKIMAHQ